MEDDDKLFLYFVINTDLGMEAGKISVQTGHAVQYVMERYWHGTQLNMTDAETAKCLVFHSWRTSPDHGKISLAANAAEFKQVRVENPDCIVVTDHGYTEVPPGSETVLAVGPMKKSERSPILQKLKPLRNLKKSSPRA